MWVRIRALAVESLDQVITQDCANSQRAIVVEARTLAEWRSWLQVCADTLGSGTSCVDPCVQGTFDPAAGPGDAVTSQVDSTVHCRVEDAEELVVQVMGVLFLARVLQLECAMTVVRGLPIDVQDFSIERHLFRISPLSGTMCSANCGQT